MTSRFPPRVQHVRTGEPVTAAVTGRATRELEGQTNFVNDKLDSILAGTATVQSNVSVAPEVLDGQPVFWNAETQRYEPGLAAVEPDLALNTLVPTASSDVVGVAINKRSGNTADIVTGGAVWFTNLANAIDGDVEPGRYYLSAVTPGKLVRQRPAVTVAVCVVLGPLDACDQGTWMIVQPQLRDFLEDHIHYQVKLKAAPAGCYVHVPDTAPTITEPDVDKRGWLPADHESFQGNAPAGAAFGYNLLAHDELSRLWPPIPVSAVLLEEFKPEDGVHVGGRVPSTRVRFDNFGIWWMDPCRAPWPTDLLTCDSSSSSSSASASSSSGTVECLVPPMELILSFIKMTFMTGRTVVTSLQPADGQPIEYVDCDGEPATTGDLFTRLLLNLLVDPAENFSGQALQAIVDNKFKRGWMTQGLVAGSTNVLLSGTRQRRLTPGDATTPLVHQDIVTVDIATDPTDRELSPVIVQLGDALERNYKGIPYLELPTDRDSALRLRYNVPSAGLPTVPKLKIRAVMFGQLTGTMTDLVLSYYRLARPSPTTLITEGDTALPFPTGVAVVADTAVEQESDEFTVAAGDTVYVTVSRAANGTPSYNAGVGLLRINAIIVAES